jgi:superoxide dismutase
MRSLIKILLIFSIPLLLSAADSDYAKTVQNIKDAFVDIVQIYKDGLVNNDEARINEAKSATQNAYFQHFENVEAGIRINLGQKKAYAMEAKFGKIRKAIIAKKPVADIEAIMVELNKELDEVLPIISSGHKLVGEYSDKSENQSQDIEQNLSDTSNNKIEFTTNIEPHWQVVYNQIKTLIQSAKDSYKNGDSENAKADINRIKFELYRNTKLEEAIRRFIEDGKELDGNLQRRMGSAIIAINNGVGVDVLSENLTELGELIYLNITKLPIESGSLATNVDIDESTPEEVVDFTSVVKNINDKIIASIKLYLSGDKNTAIGNTQDIYFDEFEGSGMENKIGAIDVGLKTEIERNFGDIVALMKAGADEAKLQISAKILQDNLQKALDKSTNSSSPASLLFYAFTIILREGFEALIIVAAVVAYLVKTGNQSRMNIVYSSLGVAVVLSFVMAWVMNLLFENAGQYREVMEGAVMLIAVSLLFYVGFWLLSNAGAKKWNEYIKTHVSESISAGSAKALWWTVFLAVFREGAETVLFYQALFFDAKNAQGYGAIGAGFGAGLVILLVVFFVFKKLSIKIPIRPFFLITSAIIFYMSIVFVGKGLMEFVEGKIFVPTKIDGFPTIELFGIYPYYESLIPQSIMIIALIVGVIVMKNKQKKEA